MTGRGFPIDFCQPGINFCHRNYSPDLPVPSTVPVRNNTEPAKAETQKKVSK